jgi:hypothetical protein
MKQISILFFCLLFLFSCDFNEAVEPPFAIRGFTIETTDEHDEFQTGAGFYFRNTAYKPVVSLIMSFRLYYSDGSYPSYGSNKVSVNFEGFISSSGEEFITIPLDSYIRIYRPMTLIADQILVEKIVYNDGTAWKDTLGFWQTGGAQ